MLTRIANPFVVVLLAFLAVFGIVVTASAAGASVHICNTNGQQGCVGASDIQTNNWPIVLKGSSGGRDITRDFVGTDSRTGWDEYLLKLTSGKCVTASSSRYVRVEPCTADYTVWEWDKASTALGIDGRWLNKKLSEGIGWTFAYGLSSDNTVNDQLTASTTGYELWYAKS